MSELNDLQREYFHEDPKTGKITYQRVSYVGGVKEDCIERKKSGTRGFSPQRHFQHIARIPADMWHDYCRKTGYYEMDNDGRKKIHLRFLKEHPEYMTVEKLKTETPNDGYIIIK